MHVILEEATTMASVPTFGEMVTAERNFRGPIPEGKVEKSFWIRAIFFLLVFGVGFAVGLTIGGSAL